MPEQAVQPSDADIVKAADFQPEKLRRHSCFLRDRHICRTGGHHGHKSGGELALFA
jgi:hypothetical protein